MKFPDWLPVYGDQSFRGRCAVESVEQIAFFDYLKLKHPKVAMIAVHQRNEGKRSFAQARWQKREGMTKGASDIIIPGLPSFVCELKRKDHTKSTWKDGQIDYLEAAWNHGAFACVALGHEAALEALLKWLRVVEQVIKDVKRASIARGGL